MKSREIFNDGVLLARHVPSNALWGEGLNFFSQDSEFLQVGTWHYESGKNLAAHKHNIVKREVLQTQELLYVVKGCIRADVYNLKQEKVETLEVNQGDVLILINGGHGYQIVDDGTKVLEVKNGPYLGAEVDRDRI